MAAPTLGVVAEEPHPHDEPYSIITLTADYIGDIKFLYSVSFPINYQDDHFRLISRPDNPSQYGFVMLHYDQVVGVITSRLEPMTIVGARVTTGPNLYIQTLAVHPDHKRQGIARRLFHHTLATVQSNIPNLRSVLLHVLASNEPALALYDSLGFSCLERIAKFYDNHPQLAGDRDALLLQIMCNETAAVRSSTALHGVSPLGATAPGEASQPQQPHDLPPSLLSTLVLSLTSWGAYTVQRIFGWLWEAPPAEPAHRPAEAESPENCPV